MPEPSTLIFGATGALGGHLLAELVTRGTAPEAITAAGRNTERLAQLAAAGFGAAALGSVGLLVSLDETIAAGTFARVGDDLTRLIGRPSTGLLEGLVANGS